MPDTTSATTDPAAFPNSGRLLGVDYGTRRVGLSISTPDQTIASPLEILHRQNLAQDQRKFQQVIEDYRVRGLVVGLPIHLNGEEGQKASEARAYGKWLAEFSHLPVAFWDERYTSAVADEFLLGAELTRDQRKKRIDMVAAQIMLQSYLDSRRPKTTERPSSDSAEEFPE